MNSDWFFNKRVTRKTRSILGLLMGVLAIMCFSVWVVPKLWHGSPNWLSWLIRIFGEDVDFRFPSFLATIFSMLVVISLHQRNFLDSSVKSVYGIMILIVNVWGVALVLELTIGRMDNFLEGGISSLLLVSLLTVSALGIRQYVPIALIGLFLMSLVNLFSIESNLFLPGFFGALFMFLSLVFQIENFFDRVKEVKLSPME